MTATDSPLHGDDLLEAVTVAMVDLHRRYHHREPVKAKTSLLGDDLLVCVMGGVYAEVEKTIIDLQRHLIVAETRNAFQTRDAGQVHRRGGAAPGRRVLAFMSDSNVGPDLEIELFVLAGR